MEHEDLNPVKEVHITKRFSEIEWIVPTDDDHKVLVRKGNGVNWAAMKRWCEQHCEDTVVIWCGGSVDVYFFFFRQSDAVAFKLRWL